MPLRAAILAALLPVACAHAPVGDARSRPTAPERERAPAAPEPDADRDGVPDARDRCPLEPMVYCGDPLPGPGEGCPDDLCPPTRRAVAP